MSSPAIPELCSFREYLDQRIAGREVELTPENVVRDWREMQESLQSIRCGIADADAGRIRTAESLLDELQARLVCR
jgi:predicted transcriptional regulator